MLARISSKVRGLENSRVAHFGVALVFGLALRLTLLPSAGNVRDMTAFRSWMFALQRGPLDTFYASAGFIDYTPGYLFVLKATAMLYGALHLSDPKALWLDALLKMPAVLGDIACAVLVYAIASRFVAPAVASVAAICVLFNPALIIVSASWGQVDSVPAAFMLGSILLLLDGHKRKHAQTIASAWVMIAVAALMKPAIYILIPLFLISVFRAHDEEGRRARAAGTLLGIAAGCVLAFAMVYAFHRDLNPLHALAWLLERYVYSSGVYAVSSVNAFNIWAVGQSFWYPDRVHPFSGVPISEAAVGIALLAGAIVAIIAVYWRKGTDEAFVIAACLLSLSFFLFPTRMHERYIFNAMILAHVCAIFGVAYRRAAAVLTLTFTCNVLYALYYAYVTDHSVAGIDAADIVPILTRPLALLNVATFILLTVIWGRSEPAAMGPVRRPDRSAFRPQS